MMMMHVLELSVLVAVAGAIITPNVVHEDLNGTVEENGARGQTALGDIFREVEELMEDRQHRLEDAVHQMNNESAKSSQTAQNLTSNYSSDSSLDIVLGNQSAPAEEKIDKIKENRTEEIHITKTPALLNSKENDTDLTCTNDMECSEGQLCVWGQCTKNATKGEAGTICAYQSDCSGDLCCSFHKALIFPVCITKPGEHERCMIAASHLTESLLWDLKGKGPTAHCPCAGDLQCQHLGRGTLCLKSQSSSEEDLMDAMYSEINYII